MNEIVSKIIKMFDRHMVLSILESPNNYIVSICDKDADLDSITDSLYAIDKKTSKVSEFSYFSKPEEYSEALKNVLYKYDETATSSDELTHWGVKGMRWGIRRYQNKDGSLTAAGKKRRAKLEAELSQLKGKRGRPSASSKTISKTPDKPAQKKTASEMTDEELRERTTRMMMEASYYNAQKSLAAANPRKVSSGEKFVNSLMNDVIAPAAKNAGRAWLENTLKDKLGLNKPQKKSLEDQLKEFNLKTLRKNEELDNIRREIAVMEAQARLDAMKKK